MTGAYLDTLISGQRRAARWQVVACVTTVSLGLLLVAGSMLFGSFLSGDYVKSILGIGGGFIATSAAFPAKEIVAIRNRIDLYSQFRLRLNNCTPEEAGQIHALIWTAIGKVASS